MNVSEDHGFGGKMMKSSSMIRIQKSRTLDSKDKALIV